MAWGFGATHGDVDTEGGLADTLQNIIGFRLRENSATEEETQGLLGKTSRQLQNVVGSAGDALGLGSGGRVSVWVEIASISKTQWLGFAVCLILGCLSMVSALAMLPLLILVPQKFAVTFTFGSLCFLGSFIFLRGFAQLANHLTDKTRRPHTLAYFGSMIATISASLWMRSSVLTLATACAQIWCLLWFFLSYIPGGTMAMQYVQGFLCGCCRVVCFESCFVRKGK